MAVLIVEIRRLFMNQTLTLFCIGGMGTESFANKVLLSSEPLIMHSGEMPLVGRWLRLQPGEDPGKLLKRTEDILGSRLKPQW